MADVFDIDELDERNYTSGAWRALERLAADDAPEVRWLDCPGGCDDRAVELQDDDGKPLIICVNAHCNAAMIALSLKEAAAWGDDADDDEDADVFFADDAEDFNDY